MFGISCPSMARRRNLLWQYHAQLKRRWQHPWQDAYLTEGGISNKSFDASCGVLSSAV